MKSLLVVFLGAIVVLFVGLGKKETKTTPLALLFIGIALALIPLDFLGKLPWSFEKNVPVDMLFFDKISLSFTAVLLLAAFLVFGLFGSKVQVGSDLLGLLMFSLSGGIILTASSNLVMVFIGIEALSIPLYVLAGSRKTNLKGNEAAIKYFLMGAFSTAIFLMGCAFVYGSTGAIDMETIYRAAYTMEHLKAVSPLLIIGTSLILVGLSFKVSAFPFHFWSPDVYEGSPNRATVFMATIVKVAAFSAIFRLFSIVLMDLRGESWGIVVAVMSACTILLGNIAALRQTNVKRTLAYSSIAHAGYMLMAILVSPEMGFWAILLYSFAYIAASVIVFYYFNEISSNRDESFEAFNGLAKNNKFGAVLLALSMFSLAGIPLTAGFAGKYSIFSAAFVEYKWLVFVALLGSAISIAYYFRIFKSVFFTDGDAKVNTTAVSAIFLGIAAIVILLLGIAPSILTNLSVFKF